MNEPKTALDALAAARAVCAAALATYEAACDACDDARDAREAARVALDEARDAADDAALARAQTATPAPTAGKEKQTMQKYTSGKNRVHSSTPAAEIRETIAEYEGFCGDLHLGAELKACARDLREELALRTAERAQGIRAKSVPVAGKET